MDEQQELLKQSMKMFYDDHADTQVQLKDNVILKFNKIALCCNARNKMLNQIFFGDLKAEEVTHITDIDSETFKLLLDHIMLFEPYTYKSAFKIFPAAWKYQIDGVIDKCIEALISTDLSNSQICDLLNTANFYSCKKLFKAILDSKDFTESRCRDILIHENYCHSLHPKSLKVVLMRIPKIDYCSMTILMDWGNNYMEKNETGCSSLREFLEQNMFLEYFKEECFDSPSEICDFILNKRGKKLLPLDKLITRLQGLLCSKAFNKCTWVRKKENETVTEKISMSGAKYVAVPNSSKFKIAYGDIKFYQSLNTYDENDTLIILKGEYRYRENPDQDFTVCYSGESKITRKMLQENLDRKTDFVVCEFKKVNDQVTLAMVRSKGNISLTWTFLYPCSVLKSDQIFKSGKLYFTKRVSSA